MRKPNISGSGGLRLVAAALAECENEGMCALDRLALGHTDLGEVFRVHVALLV